MKSVYSFLILLTTALAGLSQGVFTNDVNSALQKVIQDYPNHFSNIKGAQVNGPTHNVEYYSTIEVPGSLNCILTQHSASKKEMYSWRCVILESEEFNPAKDKFAELYNQIGNTIVTVEGEKPFILNGKYEAPSDANKITRVSFQLLPAHNQMQKLKVELTLQHYINGWKVILTVSDHERTTDEQPQLTDRW